MSIEISMSEFTDKFKERMGFTYPKERIKNYSLILCEKYSSYFTEWWDPNNFDWDYSGVLAQNGSSDLKVWWNSKKFHWEYSWKLAKYCSSNFDTWWDPEKYDWKWDSGNLAQYCSSDFDKWWDPNKFNYDYQKHLIENCQKDVLVWFDKKKIDICDLDPCSIVLLKKLDRL